jgi:hypothetical protein
VDTTVIEGHDILIMELLGDSLRSLKENEPGKRLSLSTGLQVLYQGVGIRFRIKYYRSRD